MFYSTVFRFRKPMVTTNPTGRLRFLALLLLWVGLAVLTPTALYAQTGQALAFDGTDDYVQVPTGTYFSGGDRTIEVWVNPRSRNNYARIIDFGNGEYQNNVYLSLNTETTGKPRFFVGGVGAATETLNPLFTSNQELPLNQWSHVAVTLSGKTASFYINGVAAGQTTFNTSPANVTRQNCYIGRSNWASDTYANASLDDLRIWNVARTAAQIAETKDCELKGNETGLVAYYNFNQGTAGGSNSGVTSLPDGTANKNAGTLNGFALSGTNSNWVAPGGAAKCVNCNTFTTRTTANGLGSNVVNKVVAVGNTVYVATNGGLSISTDGGQTFVNKVINGSATKNVDVVGNSIYTTASGVLARSTDGGQTFTTLHNIPQAMLSLFVGENTIITPHGNSGQYQLSTNGGQSFSSKMASVSNSKAAFFGISGANGKLYVAAGAGQISPRGGLYVSTDNGQNFTLNSNLNRDLNGLSVYAINNMIYFAARTGLFISADGGSSFVQRTTANGLGQNLVYDVYAVGNRVYAATENGLSISTDGGQTFTNYTTVNGLPAAKIKAVYAIGSMVYAATDAGLAIADFGVQTIVPGGNRFFASEITAAPGTSLTLRAADTNSGYSWSPGNATTKDLVVTASGNYSVTATGDCPGTGSVAVTYLTAQPTNAVQVTTTGSGVARVTITIPTTGAGGRLAATEGVKPGSTRAPTVRVTVSPKPGGRLAAGAPTPAAITLRAKPRTAAGGRASAATYTVTIPIKGTGRTYTIETYDSVTKKLLSVQTFKR